MSQTWKSISKTHFARLVRTMMASIHVFTGSLYQHSLLVKLNCFSIPHFVKPYSFIDKLGVDVAISNCPIFQLFLKLPISRIGCIPAEELKFVMNHLPGKVCI